MNGSLSLTYDDGPGSHLTPRVTKVLAEHGVKATFFLLGSRAELSPEVVDMLAADGHELACHSYAHLNAWKVTPWRAARDIDAGYRALARWIKPNSLFRPPYGKYTPFTWLQIRRRGAKLVRWTHDSYDTTHGDLPAPADIVQRVGSDGGGMVLMHDFDREGEPAYAAARAGYVLDVTRGLLRLASERAWPVVTASEYLQAQSKGAWRRGRLWRLRRILLPLASSGVTRGSRS